MTDPELIAAALKAAGVSEERFAERLLARDGRNVYRWLSGSTPIPQTVKARLYWFLGLSEHKRKRLISLMD